MIKLLKRFTAREWLMTLGVVVFMVGSVWLTLTLPDYMTTVTTIVKSGGSIEEVLSAGWKMLACALGEGCCTVIIGFLTARVSMGFARRLRRDVYAKVVDFSMEEIHGFSTASLVTRTGNDVTQIQMAFAISLQAILRAPIIAIWAICKIWGKGGEWLTITAIAVLLVLILVGTNIGIVIPKFRIIQRLTDSLNRVTSENLTGVRVVRAYNAEEFQMERFGEVNTDVTKVHLFTGRVMAYLFPGITLVQNFTTVAIYAAGALIINAASTAARVGIYSDLIVFMAYAMQIIIAFMMLGMVFLIIPRAQVCAGRINEVLDREIKIKDGPLEDVPDAGGTVEFRNVYFSYPDADEPVLENISFKADKGDTVAIIGSTGSGKSTLLNLIPRFYDVTAGEVLVDGVNVKEYKQKNLHGKLGYVSQKAILFKGTLRENVDYGINDRDHEDEGIIHALEVAQGGDILKKEEKGIMADVAQAGSNFSGGQKQRISIARAIYRHPEIFIFDDSFSALDYKTDKNLRMELKKETQGATVIIVAQRIGTVKDADKILVLDEGKMAGIGTHKELLKTCEVYRQIAYSQLSKEELENA